MDTDATEVSGKNSPLKWGRWSFGSGALLIILWFVLQGGGAAHFDLEEWGLFYLIALVSWQPMSRWLVAPSRWIPAAEVFFVLHIPYYVAPFTRGVPKYAELAVESRLVVGSAILGFLVAARLCYGLLRNQVDLGRTKFGYFFNATLSDVWRDQVAWFAFVLWALTVFSLQFGWSFDLGTYFQTFRTLIYNAGNIGTFVLAYDLGANRLTPLAKRTFLSGFVAIILVELSSGYLISAAVESALAFLAFSYSRKRLPLLCLVACALLFSFLQLGKSDMRQKYWSESAESTNIVSILSFWTVASWNRMFAMSGDEVAGQSLLERGDLLSFTSRVISETPEFRPFLSGLTYIQTASIFIPRFIWPDKPRTSTPNETLAIHYGIQDIDSVNFTAISLGKIAEGWGNFGWLGVVSAGAFMGFFLSIPTRLSMGYGPLHVRFLFAVPFITMAMKLEECIGPGLHPLVGALLLIAPFLWLASMPSGSVSDSCYDQSNVGTSAPAPVRD